jgi:hypothetical protein
LVEELGLELHRQVTRDGLVARAPPGPDDWMYDGGTLSEGIISRIVVRPKELHALYRHGAVVMVR